MILWCGRLCVLGMWLVVNWLGLCMLSSMKLDVLDVNVLCMF